MMIMTLKDAVTDFFPNLPSALLTDPSAGIHVAVAQLCANHVRHIEQTVIMCKVSRVLSDEVKGQLSHEIGQI